MTPIALHNSAGGTMLRLCAVASFIGGLVASAASITYAIGGVLAGLCLLAAAQAVDAVVTIARDVERRRLLPAPVPAAHPPGEPITHQNIAAAEAALKRAREA